MTITKERATAARVLSGLRHKINQRRAEKSEELAGMVHFAKTYQAFIRVKGWQKGKAPPRFQTAECPCCTTTVNITFKTNDNGHVVCPICSTLFTIGEE